MPRRFVALNLALAAAATLLIMYIVRQFVAPMPLPVGGRRAAGPAMSTVTETAKTPASAYNVVAARNLFSPTRTEAPSSTAVTALPVTRPNLFGVVVRDSGSIAYLEDPTTKRVAGYRVGDKIQGATVQAIKADGVTIDGPGGPMDVRLHEPSKPRATPAAATATPPSAAPALPGVIPPAPAATVPGPPQAAQPLPQPAQPGMVPPVAQPPVVGVPGQPGVTPPVIPGRRPLPPNLLRRLPPGMGDAPQQ
jgi:Type II secretion system protein C